MKFNRENPIHRIKSYLGSGSADSDPDPDPNQNDMDPKHCFKLKKNFKIFTNQTVT